MLSAWMENTKGAEIYLIFLVGILLIPAWFMVVIIIHFLKPSTKHQSQANREPERMKRVQFAESRGWSYDDTREPGQHDVSYRYGGTTPGGLDWLLEYHNSFLQSSADPFFRWSCWPPPKVKWPSCIVVCPAGRFRTGAEYTASMRDRVTNFTWSRGFHFRALHGSEALDAFLRSAAPLQTGNTEFSSAFQVLLHNQVLGKQVFTPPVLHDLLKWPAALEKFDAKRRVSLNVYDSEMLFEVRWPYEFQSDVYEHLVKLGGTIADSLSVPISAP